MMKNTKAVLIGILSLLFYYFVSHLMFLSQYNENYATIQNAMFFVLPAQSINQCFCRRKNRAARLRFPFRYAGDAALFLLNCPQMLWFHSNTHTLCSSFLFIRDPSIRVIAMGGRAAI